MQSEDVTTENCPVPEIDADAGTDLRAILSPLSPPHNISAERIEHISRACTSVERVEGVAMRLRASFARKSRNCGLITLASTVSFILIAVVVVANVWLQADVLRKWRVAMPLAMFCIIVFENWRQRRWADYEDRFNCAVKRLQDIIALGRGTAGDGKDDKKKD